MQGGYEIEWHGDDEYDVKHSGNNDGFLHLLTGE